MVARFVLGEILVRIWRLGTTAALTILSDLTYNLNVFNFEHVQITRRIESHGRSDIYHRFLLLLVAVVRFMFFRFLAKKGTGSRNRTRILGATERWFQYPGAMAATLDDYSRTFVHYQSRHSTYADQNRDAHLFEDWFADIHVDLAWNGSATFQTTNNLL